MPERSSPKGVLLDVDGTLQEDDIALPGAVGAVARLRAAGVAVRFVTNTTRRPASEVAARLRGLGFDVRDGELVTPAIAAGRWLELQGIRRIRLYLPDGAAEDFRGFALRSARPQAIVVGDLGAGWTFARLNDAFRDLREGARLVALHRNRAWRSGGELILDAGAFVAALEYAARVEAVVVGKPSADFFRLACAGVDAAADEVLMVGDDVEADIAGAQRAGLRAVLVRTGKYDERAPSTTEVRPDAVIDDVSALPSLLGV